MNFKIVQSPCGGRGRSDTMVLLDMIGVLMAGFNHLTVAGVGQTFR